MGYITESRTGTRTLDKQNTGTRTAYKTAYSTMEANLGFDLIPIIRPNFSYFSFSGLRPNSPHWIFFDGKRITHFCNTSFNSATYNTLNRNNSIRNPGDKYIHETGFPAELGGPTAAVGQPVYSDASGNLDGLFYIQSNAATSFPTGNRSLVVSDISILDKEECLSWAQAEYAAVGEYELYYQYQHAYQQAYSETYQYTTSYEEEYQYNVQTWVDDPPVPPHVPTVVPDPVAPDTPFVPVPPPEEEPPVTPAVIESGSSETTTTKSSSKGGGGTKMKHVVETDKNGNKTTYYMNEEAANIRINNDNMSFTNKDGSKNKPKPRKTTGNQTVLCSLLHRRGYLSEEIWRLDTAYGQMTRDTDPDVYDGYYAWAQPVVEWIERDTMLARIGFYTLALPLVSSWAKHIAHRMEPDNHKDNLLGRFIITIGVPSCRAIGKMIKDKRVKV